jgi:hypothetical protein
MTVQTHVGRADFAAGIAQITTRDFGIDCRLDKVLQSSRRRLAE